MPTASSDRAEPVAGRLSRGASGFATVARWPAYHSALDPLSPYCRIERVLCTGVPASGHPTMAGQPRERFGQGLLLEKDFACDAVWHFVCECSSVVAWTIACDDDAVGSGAHGYVLEVPDRGVQAFVEHLAVFDLNVDVLSGGRHAGFLYVR